MQKTSFSLRQANECDVAMLRELSITTFTETYAAFNTAEDMRMHIDEKFNLQTQLMELADDNNLFCIAFYENIPAGYIKLRTSAVQPVFQNRKHIELERIYVLQNFHGMGLGYLLAEECINQAKLKGCDVLWLGVWKQNKKAIAFYTKCGFEIFGEQIFTLGSDPQQDWLMKKELFG